MNTKVVFLSDDLHAREEAFSYAVELAARMRCDLILLMLLSFEGAFSAAVDRSEQLQTSVQEVFLPQLRTARSAGIQVEPVLRLGDQYSELMKFLAETRAISSIVWGGEPTVLQKKSAAMRSHWLTRIRDRVDPPLVVPSFKTRHQNDRRWQ